MKVPVGLAQFSRGWERARAIRPRYYAGGALVLVAAIFAARLFTSEDAGTAAQTFHELKRDDFMVSVLAGGSLNAVNEVTVRCELEGASQIVHIVPEGTQVEKGDVLIELDRSGIEERLTQQELAYQSSIEASAQVEANLDIQRSVGEGLIATAELNAENAASDLEKYREGEWPQAKKMAEAKITLAQEELKRAVDRRDWTVKLQEKGYATKSELEADQLAVKRQEIALDQAQEELRLLITYDYPKILRKMEMAVKTADREVGRVKAQFAAQMSQGRAGVVAKKATLELQKEQLEKLREQLAKTQIIAPQDGLVVYADSNSRSATIGEGAIVRERQELIKLPDTSKMLVKVQVHESQINNLQTGLPAWVVIDSMPDRRYKAKVGMIAPLPDAESRWTNPNLKVYTTEVVIEEALGGVKPGVSAQAEIVVSNLHDVLTVPIQAVTTVGGKQVVHVQSGSTLEPVPVEVGLYNHRYIEIRSGLEEGALVALA
ncbi:MAG: efflux RND transporter periplasmic adaptor subunit, partial [Chthoniobacteraceae bacterium]